MMRRTMLAVPVLAAAALAAAAGGGPAPAKAAGTPVQHVVVLYLENHSFDSILGFWCDQNPGRCPSGGMPATVTLKGGVSVTPSVTPDLVPTVDHNVRWQGTAIDGGKMDGWAAIPGCGAPSYACVSGYTPAGIPNVTALASQFAISDATFSMHDSPSWGGHLYALAATLDGFSGENPGCGPGTTCPVGGWGCASDWLTPWGPQGLMEPPCVPDPNLPPAQYPYGGAQSPTPVPYVPTILDRLDAAGLPWRIYDSAQHTAHATWAACPSFAECFYTSQASNWVSYSQFTAAAAAGTLPAFSLIEPGGAQTQDAEHNGMSMTAGDQWLGQVAQAVENSPDWSSTVLFITWDDCGCFYDQVPPPLNAEGQQEGPRSPVIIVSPYAKPGYTDDTPTTFAGILAYTEQTFGLAPLSPEDAAAYDFTGAFDYTQPPTAKARIVTRPVPAWASKPLPASVTSDPT
jgi:phospholipase C